MRFKSLLKPISIAILVLGLSRSALAMDKVGAALDGDTKAVEWLLNRGLSIEHKFSPLNSTLLAVFAEAGNLEAVEFLLKKGASIDAVDSLNFTPLLHAVYKGHLNIARLLLDWGADVNAIENSMGLSPLHEACSQGNLELTKLLLEYGADTNLKDKYWGMPAVVKAQQKGHTAIVALLSDEDIYWTPILGPFFRTC
jgi:ankyrin repeat protein